jgi:uncharacterized protein (DUF58 family)
MNWKTSTSGFFSAMRGQRLLRDGLAFFLAFLIVALAAFLSANNLMFLILAAMLATLLVSGLINRLGLAGLQLDLLLPEHLSARRKVRAAIRVKNLKRWMSSFSIHLDGAPDSGFNVSLYFPMILGGGAVEEPVELLFPRRGLQKERSFQFSTSFPFGFSERRENVTANHEVVIYPCLDPQPGFEELYEAVAGDIEAMRRGQGSDFYRIRPYEMFESARHVDWKATAHTGGLQVREFAQHEDLRVIIFLDLDVPDWSSDWFELAVECTAFLAYRLAPTGVAVRLRTQNFDATIPREASIYAVLRYLALAAPERGRELLPSDDPSSIPIVFTLRPDRARSLGWCQGKGHMVDLTRGAGFTR